jgi:sporulation protein YlmC with PRC-barrel domain
MKKTLTKLVLSVSAGALMGLQPALLANDPQVRGTVDNWPDRHPTTRPGVQFDTQERQFRYAPEDRVYTQERFQTQERYRTLDRPVFDDRAGFQTSRQQFRDFPTAHPETARLQSASRLIGMDVRDRNDRNVGSVNDFLVELPSGRVPLALLSAGGFLGIGQRDIVIPPAELQLYPMDDTVRISLSRDEFRTAPVLRENRFPTRLDQAWTRDVYRYYGQTPDGFRETRIQMEPPRRFEWQPPTRVEREVWRERGFRDPAGAALPETHGAVMTSDEEADMILRRYQRGKTSAEALEEQLRRARADAAYHAQLGDAGAVHLRTQPAGPRITTYDYIRDPAGAELRTAPHGRQHAVEQDIILRDPAGAQPRGAFRAEQDRFQADTRYREYPETRREVEIRERQVYRDQQFRDRDPQFRDRMAFQDRDTMRYRDTDRDVQFRQRDQREIRDQQMRDGTVFRARDLLGMQIRDERDQTIGRIQDLIIDLPTGHVALAVVEPTRDLGIGNQVLVLPPAMLMTGQNDRTLLVRVDQEQLRRGPLLRRDEWQRQVNLNMTRDVYEYYGARPFWTEERIGMRQEFRGPAERQRLDTFRDDTRRDVFRDETRREFLQRDQDVRRTEQFPRERWEREEWRRDDQWQRDAEWRTGDQWREEQLRRDTRMERDPGLQRDQRQWREQRDDWQREQWMREQRLRDEQRLRRDQPFREGYRPEIREPAGAPLDQDRFRDQQQPQPQLRFPAGTDQMRDHQWERLHQEREFQRQQQHPGTGAEIRDPAGASLPRAEQQTGRQMDHQIMTSLRQDPSLVEEARNVQVYREHGTIVLRGTVSSDEQKRRIEQLVLEAADQQPVASELRVARSGETLQDQRFQEQGQPFERNPGQR